MRTLSTSMSPLALCYPSHLTSRQSRVVSFSSSEGGAFQRGRRLPFASGGEITTPIAMLCRCYTPTPPYPTSIPPPTLAHSHPARPKLHPTYTRPRVTHTHGTPSPSQSPSPPQHEKPPIPRTHTCNQPQPSTSTSTLIPTQYNTPTNTTSPSTLPTPDPYP